MEKYLRKCLDSLIVPAGQMEQLEVLVINDGSKDSSSAIAHEYQDKYPNTFRVIDKENGNYGSCINRGLKEATGKYVKVLDADDWFDNNSFSLYVNYIGKLDVDLIITNYTLVHESSKDKVEISYRLPPMMSFEEAMHYSEFTKMEMHAITYKTKNLLDMNYRQSEGISYTDQEWMFMPMTQVNTISYLRQDLYQYRIGREGQTIDVKTLAKGTPILIGIQRECIKRWLVFPKSDIHWHYLYQRLIFRFNFVYVRKIILTNMPQVEYLREFDLWLRDNASKLYSYLDSIILSKKIPYHYITHWRKSYSISKYNILVNLYVLKRRIHKEW